MTHLTDILYWISTGLLVPVIITLILLFLRSLILLGAFFGQYIAFRKNSSHTPLGIAYIRRLNDSKGGRAESKRLLAQFEIEADRDLSTSKLAWHTNSTTVRSSMCRNEACSHPLPLFLLSESQDESRMVSGFGSVGEGERTSQHRHELS